MKKHILLIITSIFALFLISCSPKTSELIVAEYGKYDITLEDFEKAYAKNVGGVENAKNDSITDYKKFLDLYVKFRMKLRDAEVRGYPTDPDMINEVESYKRKVGASYVLEREFVEPALKKLYEQREEELRVSHIMFRTNESEDEARELAEKVLDSLKAGADFDEMASRHSQDTYTKNKGGDVYWITAGEIVPEFEEAAYETKVGEIYPEVVKTRFGFHIVKVTDKQPRKYKVKARHILLKETAVTDSSDTSSAYYKISDIKRRIENGEDFAELAKQYSDDPGSGARGGDLGEFTRRRMVQPFDQAAFNLNVGELSDIVKTQFGYHLIEVTEIFDYPKFDGEKETLRELYKRTKYDRDYKAFIDSLKLDYNFVKHDDNFGYLLNHADTVKMQREYWESNMQKDLGERPVFTINNKEVIIDSMISYGIMERTFQNKVINNQTNLNNLSEKFAEQSLLEEKALTLDQTNPTFASLMEDYRNGIFIFKLQEDEVWNRLKVDSTKVKKYFEKHAGDYTFNDRVEFLEIFVKEDSLVSVVYNKVKSGAQFELLASEYTRRPGFTAKKGNHGVVEVEGSELAQKAFALDKPGDISEPQKFQAGWTIIKLVDKYPARNKTFEEAKPEVMSAYQEMLSKKLEDEYVDRLNKLYDPSINYEALEKAFKEKSE